MVSTDSLVWDEPRLVHRMLRYRDGHRSLLFRLRWPALTVVAVLAIIGLYLLVHASPDSRTESIAAGLLLSAALVLAATPFLPEVPRAPQRRIELSSKYLAISSKTRELTGKERQLSELGPVEILEGRVDDLRVDMLRFEHPEQGAIYVGLSNSIDQRQVLELLQNAGLDCESTGRRMRLDIEDDSPFVDYLGGTMSEKEIEEAESAYVESMKGGIRWTEPWGAVRMWQRARFSLGGRRFSRFGLAGGGLFLGLLATGFMVLSVRSEEPMHAADYGVTLSFSLAVGTLFGFFIIGVFKLVDLGENRFIHVRSSVGVYAERWAVEEKMGPRLVVGDKADAKIEVGPRLRGLLFVPYDNVRRAEIVSTQVGSRNYKFLRLITHDGEGYAFGLGVRSDPKTLLSFVNRCIARAADEVAANGDEQPTAAESEFTGNSASAAQPDPTDEPDAGATAAGSALPLKATPAQPEKGKPDEPVDEDLAKFFKGFGS